MPVRVIAQGGTYPVNWTALIQGQSAKRPVQNAKEHNVSAEKFNEVSVEQTLNCKNDKVAYPDVGPALQAFYAYTQDDMVDMIGSNIYCGDVGPLPVFIRQQVERSRRKRAETTEADKIDKEKKAKGRALHGAMVLSNPIVRIAGQAATVLVSNVVLQSILHKLYVPLHWFTDTRLLFIQHRLHDLPTKVIQPDDALNTDKVVVFDMLKMVSLSGWGSDESSACLSPLKWQQAARNLHAGLVILSEDVSANPTKANFGVEFGKHLAFFLAYPKFEENYADWYDFEREARHEILQGFLFDGDTLAAPLEAETAAATAPQPTPTAATARRATQQ
ncbi:hypothetical protein C8R46DRAFT_1294472 [Mycena filopes]|nr:hypothetical protein C8R46DRAFT_1294472 [Mycena filopes]